MTDQTCPIDSPTEWTDLPPRPRAPTRPRVLVVDDDADFLELATTGLAAEGFDVATARTAGEAVVEAVRQPPDLILLDILLHGSDGIDVLEALRDEPETRHVPIVACTALGERDAAGLLTRCGFDGLVSKPFDLLGVARALREALPPRE
jgi:CheY-like chemotaxis protein